MGYDPLAILGCLNILYIEDDPVFRDSTIPVLEKLCGNVTCGEEAEQATRIFYHHTIHIAIIDIKLPGINGLSLIRKLRETHQETPIIITTAYLETDYLLEAVKLNLVDYLLKPFSFKQIKKSLLDGVTRLKDAGLLKRPISDDLTYDFVRKELHASDDALIQLTQHEVRLLELLLLRHKTLATPAEIELLVYQGEPVTPEGIKNLIYRLRKKIGKDAITTIKNEGYCLV